MSKKSKWTGILNKPIRTLDVNRPEGYSVVDADNIERINLKMNELLDEALNIEINKRFDELFKHYEVDDKNNWKILSFKLAEEFVPGFKIELNIINENITYLKWDEKNIGRKLEWTPDKLTKLLFDVVNIKKKEKLKSERDACRLLARKSKFWKQPETHKGDLDQWIGTMLARLQDAKMAKTRFDRQVIRANETISEIQKKYK